MARGIGKSARESWSGDRGPASMERPTSGFYCGIVMDDQDDQMMGRIWVYIPSFSSMRVDENSIPNYGGTTPDRQSGRFQYDEKLRLGWIPCFPILPFAGGDDYRVSRGVDGRNARMGDTNTYGMWMQPRNGDTVGILFDQADPSAAYWIGMVPKQFRNHMIPGMAGLPREDIREDSSRVTDQTESGAIIPSIDRTRDGDEPYPDGYMAATLFADNLIASGLGYDIHRGAGTSSSRRESPSYVLGIKTPGWVYDSEKYNKNADGSQFEGNTLRYAGVNTTGHQFVMDDHPDHQGIRIRTSAGSQIYLNDACNNPYIYISTARGNVWVEMGDDGNFSVFGEGSFNLHAKRDINLTAGRDFNVEAFGNINLFAHDDYRMTAGGETHISHVGNMFVSNEGDINHNITGSYKTLISGNSSLDIGGDYTARTTGDHSQSIYGSRFERISGGDYLYADGIKSIESLRLYLNSGILTTPNTPETPISVSFPKLKKKPGMPTPADIKGGSAGDPVEYLSSIVPQHQPWPLRCGGGSSTKGTNGSVGPRGDNRNVRGNCNPDARKNFRTGANEVDSIKPLPIIDQSGALPIYVEGQDYITTNLDEIPRYLRDFAMPFFPTDGPNLIQPIAKVLYGDDLVDFIEEKETFSPLPSFDTKGNPIIGYGHEMQVGDNIGGVPITNKTLTDLRNGGVTATDQPIAVTTEQARDILVGELNQTQEEVRGLFPDETEIHMDMFSSLVSLARNVGVEQLRNTQEGRNIINGIVEGDNLKVQENFMKFAYVDGVLDCSVQNRRAEEMANSNSNPYGETPSSYQPGDPVGCADMNIDSNILLASQEISEKYGIPYEYLMGVGYVESKFRTNVSPGTSSALGVWQFLKSTWTDYGGGDYSDRTDPLKNVDPMGKFTGGNINVLRNRLGREPNYTEIYMAHFLGAGGGSNFLDQYYQRDPNEIAATSLPREANANPWVFYYTKKNADGKHVPDLSRPKTYGEIYGDMDRKISSGVTSYGGCTLPETIPPEEDED